MMELMVIVQTLGIENAADITEKINDAVSEQLAEQTKKYDKYKIKNKGAKPDHILIDLRNYNNFRSTRNTTMPPAEKAIAVTDMQAGSTPSKSYYMSMGDFLFSEDFDMNISTNKKIQYARLIINLKQPLLVTRTGTLALSITNGLTNFLSGTLSDIPGLDKLANTTYFKKGWAAISSTVDANIANYLTALYSLQPNTLYNNLETFNPISMYRKLFEAGIWLNTYEVPYFALDYLAADVRDAWSIGGMEALFGKTITEIANTLSIDIPTRPQFNLGDISLRVHPDITTTFYLINKTLYWLLRNFKFLHALFAGANWVHLTYGKIKSSNVYSVLCPGRFYIMWATMGITIKMKGKLRKNLTMINRYRTYINSINEDFLWPEAWLITLNFKSLVPLNFNTYIDYFVNGFTPGKFIGTDKSNGVNYLLSFMGGMEKKDRENLEDQLKTLLDKQLAARAANATNILAVTRPLASLTITETIEKDGKKIQIQRQVTADDLKKFREKVAAANGKPLNLNDLNDNEKAIYAALTESLKMQENMRRNNAGIADNQLDKAASSYLGFYINLQVNSTATQYGIELNKKQKTPLALKEMSFIEYVLDPKYEPEKLKLLRKKKQKETHEKYKKTDASGWGNTGTA